MPEIQAVTIIVSILGHLALWVAFLSRLHGLGLPERVMLRGEKLILGSMLASLGIIMAVALRLDGIILHPLDAIHSQWALAIYFWLCFGMGVRVIGGWVWRRFRGTPKQYLQLRREIIRVDRETSPSPCADRATRWMAAIPGNQIFQLELAEKTLLLPNLSSELDDLVVAHLSDIHLTGHMTRAFYELLVQRTNAMAPDVITLTGDIMDNPDCVPWIVEILADLRAPGGVYAILGNHELRLKGTGPLLEAFEQAGIQYLGGRSVGCEIRGVPVLVSGNEIPWFHGPPDLDTLRDATDQYGLRLLLSHSPDQIFWASSHDFDLMLAGHTHGGQICPPLIGPIFGHSLYGLTFCSGVYYRRPTVLHVSRGTCQTQPLRINCRPELAKLVLRAGQRA